MTPVSYTGESTCLKIVSRRDGLTDYAEVARLLFSLMKKGLVIIYRTVALYSALGLHYKKDTGGVPVQSKYVADL